VNPARSRGPRAPTLLGLLVRDRPDQARTELEAAIVAQSGNVAATARDLGVSVESVWRWIRLLGITVERPKKAKNGSS
jgi:transcriptional regulator of acetoin/glycerol metabolism